MKPFHIAPLLLCAFLATPVVAQTSFTYQGRLTENGTAVSGAYDFQFRLYSAGAGGVQVGSVLSRDDVTVTEGLFTVALDFGSTAFPGADRYLAISVRPGASVSDYTPMLPRVQVTATPYAITASSFSGAVTSGQLSGTYSGAVTFNNAANSFTGDGAGLTGVSATQLNGQPAAFYQNAANLNAGTLPAGRLPGNVVLTDGDPVFSGTPAFNGGQSGVSPPFTVDSTTLVANLNADQLDGRNGNYYLNADNLNGTLPSSTLAPDSITAVKLATDVASLAKVSGGLIVPNGPNIGVGTASAAAALEVRGDVRLGPNGEFLAPSSQENLRIIRGIVTPTGGIYNGTGFTITKKGTGNYSINFDPPFAGAPALILTAYTQTAPAVANCTGGTGNGFSDISTWVGDTKTDSWFNLIAIGAR